MRVVQREGSLEEFSVPKEFGQRFSSQASILPAFGKKHVLKGSELT